MPNMPRLKLTEIPLDTIFVIVEVVGGRGIKKQLRDIGLGEGVELTLIAMQPAGGPLVVRTQSSMITLGRGKAERIMVEIQDEKPSTGVKSG
ncbi:MAG: FeoA family protein [Candidatus Altiarchaeota archaeon]